MSSDLKDDREPTERLPGRRHPLGEGGDESPAGYTPGTQPKVPMGASPRLAAGYCLARRFVILRFLARGGMGEVYEAQDQVLRANVALKTILPELGADPGLLERFRREVLLARKASHPNVCRVYDLYSTHTPEGEALNFLTMEFLEGETLGQRLKRQGRMSPGEVLPVLRQIAAGLDAAHAEGVVHRDFKTNNVMLVPRQTGEAHSGEMRAVVTDFGIARALNSEEAAGEQVTGAGLLGTPQYMAPEQITGANVGPATDIYALGLVLYEMLTGTTPFVGATPLEAAVKRVTERPSPLRSVVSELDPRWNSAVLKCLERDPGARFSTAGDIVRFLERPAPVVSRRRVLTVALASLALALGANVVPSLLRKHARQTQAAPAFHPRVPVAVAGFTSVGDLGEQAWVPSTLSELLQMELAAAETSLRVPSAWRGESSSFGAISNSSRWDVGLAKRSLGLTDADLASPEARRRLSALLGTQWLLTGTIRPSSQSPGQLEVQMSVYGSESLAGSPISETFAPDDLLAASTRLGERLRAALDVSLSNKESEQLRAARPQSLTAARRYADGLQRLTRTDYPGAQQAFAASTAADGSFNAAHVAEAGSWLILGYRKRARDAAQRARQTATALSEREQQLAEALALLAAGDERGSRDVHRRLFDSWPDDPNLVLELMDPTSPQESRLAALERWRKASGNSPQNLFVQMAAANLKARTGQTKEAKALLDETEQRARAIGARTELGEVLYQRADESKDPKDIFQAMTAAEVVFNAVPEPDTVARIKMVLADELVWNGDASQAVALATEGLSEFRRLGMQEEVATALLTLRLIAHFMGDVRGSEHRLSEYGDQMRSIDAPERVVYFREKAWHAWLKGDIWETRQALVEWRRRDHEERAIREDAALLSLLLREEDRLAEARAELELARSVGGIWQDDQPDDPPAMACRLECDSQKYKEGLACLEAMRPTVLEPFRRALLAIDEGECRVAMSEAAGALEALEQASDVVKYPQLAARRDVLRAQADAQLGRTATAVTQLRKTLAAAELRRWGLTALETKLALGDVELRAGRAQGRPRLVKLEEEARSKGFLRIARLAHEALDSKGQSPQVH